MRKEAYEILKGSDDKMIQFIGLIVNNADFNNQRPYSVCALAKKFDVHHSQIRRWCEKLNVVLLRVGDKTLILTAQRAAKYV